MQGCKLHRTLLEMFILKLLKLYWCWTSKWLFCTCCIAFCMSMYMIKFWSLCLVIAHSISEEFSSSDARYHESEDYPHTREKGKEKEDRDEGKISILHVVNVVNCTFTTSHCCWCWMNCANAGIETCHVFCNRYSDYKAWYKLRGIGHYLIFYTCSIEIVFSIFWSTCKFLYV